MDHEGEVGLVVAHAERSGGDHDADAVLAQRLLDREPLLRIGLACVGARVDTGRAEECGKPLRLADGQRVDDPRSRKGGEVGGDPRVPLSGVAEVHDAEMEALAIEVAAQDERVDPELRGDVVDHILGRGGGGGEHRRVVGAEVVPPLADAVRLVDDQHPGAAREPGEKLVAERRVVQALRADEKEVDEPGAEVVADLLPVVAVAGVERHRAHTEPRRHRHLVAHQRQQRADEQHRAAATLAEKAGGEHVDGGLSPAGALHDEHSPTSIDQRRDRRSLVGAESRAREDVVEQLVKGLQ